MATSLINVSFGGSPVYFRLDSPLIVCFDPLALDMIREQVALLAANASIDVGQVLERMNVHHPAMSCYVVADFQLGLYSLDPRNIRKFGKEEQDLDYDDVQEEEQIAADNSASFPFVAVDSGTLIFADFGHLFKLVDRFSWEQYDLALQDEMVFARIADELGGPYFAVVVGECMPGMEFDGDGTYTINAGCFRRCQD